MKKVKLYHVWKNTYKDYKPNDKFIQTKVETGKGISGCEMNEAYGWEKSTKILEQAKDRCFASFCVGY
jgi:hypothetical protein